MNQSQYIQKVVENFTYEQIKYSLLQVKVSIDVVRWLVFQGFAFCDRDESSGSINRGNFHEMLNLLG